MHTDGQNRLKKTRNRNLHFLAWHRIPTCDLLVCREPKIEKCYFIKMSDLWRLIPTPLMYIFTKRFGRGEVELGTVLKRSKLHEKHNQSLKKPRYMHFTVYIFKATPVHGHISIVCIKTTRLLSSTHGRQKMAEPIIIPHFIEPALWAA